MAVNVDKFKKRIIAEQQRLLADKARLNNHEEGNQATGDLVEGNLVGTDATGTAAIPGGANGFASNSPLE